MFAVFRVGECRDRVLYNAVQNVVVMNTSAFYLQRSLMCVANVHAACFLLCGIIIYSKTRQSPTIYIFIYLFKCVWCSFIEVMSKIITLRIITVFSLQFV